MGLIENPVTPLRDLGVGKQQLVEIAKALSKKVRLLILDEPTAALNEADSAHLLACWATSARGHHRDHPPQAERDKCRRPDHGASRRPHDRDAAESARREVSEDRLIKGMVGRDLDTATRRGAADRRGICCDRGLDCAPSPTRPSGWSSRRAT